MLCKIANLAKDAGFYEVIESDSFLQQTFRSSKEVKKSVEPSEEKHSAAASGPASVVADPLSNEK